MRQLVLFATSLLLCGCASTTYTLTGVPVGNQVTTMDRGTASTVSAWRDTSVAVQPIDADLQGNLALWVTITNSSNTAVNFGTENVQISYDGKVWLPVKTYEQLKAKLDGDAAGAKFAALLVGGLDVWAASNSGHYTASGIVDTPYGVGTYSVDGVDPRARQDAIDGAVARTGHNFEAIDENHDANIVRLNAQALRTTTVGAGDSYGGVVVADQPALDRNQASLILVRVNVLNDSHVLEFQARRTDGNVAALVSDAEFAPIFAAEAAHNLVPTTAAAAPQNTPPAQVALCTKNDEELIRLAKQNGYTYHSTCN